MKSYLNQSWINRRLLFGPNKDLFWSKTHAMLPTPLKVSETKFRIYYSGRNHLNQSHVGWFELDVSNEPLVTLVCNEPVLSPGRLGTFDDNGVSPSSILELGRGNIGMYYIGWNPGSTTRFNLFGGLAISTDGGFSFVRYSEAPILERTKSDPFINTAPWVVKDGNGFRMFYVSGMEWITKDLPRYIIKTATSEDGFFWHRNGQVALNFSNELENALARPFVRFNGVLWQMWFSTKGTNYQIEYAESSDAVNWVRKKCGLEFNSSIGDLGSTMVEYGVVISSKNKDWLLYNGDNYGEQGIGIADLKPI